jgi:Tol biopolymer transport system component
VRSFDFTENVSMPRSGARFSPDGMRVAFALYRGEFNGREDVVVCNTQSTVNCRIYFNLEDPSWIDNSRLIAISADDEKRLFTIDLSTTNVRQVAGTFPYQLASPVATRDGQTIILEQADWRPERIVAVNIATGASREISTAGTGQYSPRVSPDGRSLGYLERAGASGVNIPVLRGVTLNINGVFQGGVDGNRVLNALGSFISPNGLEFGITSAVN